jgi:hypothetical protein
VQNRATLAEKTILAKSHIQSLSVIFTANNPVKMPLSWNEIKTRATSFSKEWENEVSEDAEAKSFWDDF